MEATHGDAWAQEMASRAEIEAVLNEYCSAVDRLDFGALREVYHPDATDHHGRFVGGIADLLVWLPDQLTERFDATVHSLSNVTVQFLTTDRATVQSTVRADHFIRASLGGGIFTFWGRYVDVFERRSSAWRILHRVIVRTASTVSPARTDNGAGFELAADSPYVPARRDEEDPGYWRDVERFRAASAGHGTGSTAQAAT
jgi:ketosteroid isomerase-like protein